MPAVAPATAVGRWLLVAGSQRPPPERQEEKDIRPVVCMSEAPNKQGEHGRGGGVVLWVTLEAVPGKRLLPSCSFGR